MRAKSFEETLRHTPFRTFEIHADGRNVLVDHPEQVLITPDKATVVVADRDGGLAILDMAHISSISLKGRRSKASSPGRPG